MVFVTFLGLHGDTIYVNVADNDLAELTAIPTGSLPSGVVAGTNIDYDDGRRIQVQGTPAATAAVLAGGGVAPSDAVYVDPAGNDATGQRGNAAFPFLTMAAAMAVAQSGDEVLVSPGTYSGAFSLPAVANLIIRGGGEFAGETILTAGAGIDVCTMNAANRSILFDTIQLAGATTGRAIVGAGTGTTFLSTGSGLVLQDVVASSAGGDTLVLSFAGGVLIRDSQLGSAIFTTCTNVFYQDSSGGDITWTFDNTAANRPAAGQSGGLILGAGTIISGSCTLGGQAKLDLKTGARVTGLLTGLNLSVAAGPVSPSITVSGAVANVDFNTTTAALPSAALGAYSVKFDGATCTGAAMTFRVASGATRQAISMVGITVPQACTYTADALCDLNMRGAALQAPTYASANTGALGVGTIVPPYLAMSGLDIAAGGALAFNFTGGFTAPAGAIAVVSQSNTGGAALAASTSTTQVTITSTAQAGNTAAAYVVWP